MTHIAEYTCTECGFHGEFDFFFQEYIYCERCRRVLYLVKVTKPETEKEKPSVCAWTQQDDAESNNWESACGDMFFFDEGTPEENGIKFCPFCGQPIIQRLYEPEPEEDE